MTLTTPRLLLAAALLGAAASHAHAQGCVAIKQMDDGICRLESMMTPSAERWNLTVACQHFRSHRHFVGTDQQFQRYYLGSEVINNVDQLDTAIGYKYNSRVTLTLGIPYFSASRSSLYEHDGVHRGTMNSRGLGDVRVSAERWLFDPQSDAKGNLAVGLGFKLPTGDTNVKAIAHTKAGDVLRNVDQSIQPGDGGFGYTFQFQAYRQLFAKTTAYASGFYLANPKETNGTRTTSSLTSVTACNSVPDQYQARLGVTRLLVPQYHLTASLGSRLEGVPALDLTGGDRGFRRPGYVLSVEPGLSLARGRDSFALSLPVAVVRNRVRSYSDRLGTGHGDAAFADFLISTAYARKW